MLLSFHVAMQDPTIDYSLQRLSKLIPKHADDPDRLSKVGSHLFFVNINRKYSFFIYLGNNS